MWGEINNGLPEINTSINLTSIKEQSRLKNCLSMYQIPSRILENRDTVLAPMDPRMLYAAEIHKRSESLGNIIEEAELAVQYNLVMQSDMPSESTLDIPDPPEIANKKPLSVFNKKYSAITLNTEKPPPIINKRTCREIEKKVIATLLAHIGFLRADESVLELLTDVFEELMRKICQGLRNASDSNPIDENTGFSDILERILITNGLGGLQGISDYYNRRVIKYEDHLKDKFLNIASNYEKLLAPVNLQLESKIDRSQEVDGQDVPEVHFTVMDGEEGYLQPFLESGFQMLNSLEEGQYFSSAAPTRQHRGKKMKS